MCQSSWIVQEVLGITANDRTSYILAARQLLKNKPDEYRERIVDYNLKNINASKDICSSCGGSCCKCAPCHFSPADFPDLTFKGLKEKIAEGNIAIQKIPFEAQEDYPFVEGSTYFLTARGVKSPISTKAYNKYTRCALLGEDGCKLSLQDRPFGGKALIPGRNNECLQLYEFEFCVLEWKPYQQILKRLYQYFKWHRY